MGTDLTVKRLADMFKEKIAELQEEPEFQWCLERMQYATDEDGDPRVKLAVGNVPLDYDLWKGLRNPAVVGLYPAGLQEIWEFYANRRKESVDEGGRQTIFQIPRSFDFARRNYRRAVIISVMLPFSPRVMGNYAQIILEERKGSSHVLIRMFQDVNLMIDKATSRLGIDLVAEDTVVVAMDNAAVTSVSTEAIPLTHQGSSHGASKGCNYPQKSVAVLMGLGQFGVGRFVIRDEVIDGRVQRFIGPLRSMIVFDQEDPSIDGSDGIIYPTETWREFLFKLSDFTEVDPDVSKYRFCPYVSHDGEGCQECVRSCHRGAQANSVPTTAGKYPEGILKQAHRFWEGKLQFDFARCREDVVQMQTLFPEWSCARCLSMCAAKGKRRTYAAETFYKKMLELTKEGKKDEGR